MKKFSIKSSIVATLGMMLINIPEAYSKDLVRVGTEPSFAPFEFMDESSKELTGFDIDLIKAIAKAEDFDVEISTMPFDALIPAILTHTLDAGISAFTITDERKRRVNFSEPYIEAGLGIAISNKYKDEIKSVDDLKGRKICAQIGTSGALYSSQIPNAQVTQFNSAAETYLELRKGGCEAIVNDRPVHAFYMATVIPDDVTLLDGYISNESYGIVVGKDNTALLQLIDNGMKRIHEDGTYDALWKKWFGSYVGK